MNSPLLVYGSTGFDIFAVSKNFRGQGEGVEQTVMFDHPSQIWLDNAITEPGGSALLAAITIARQSIETNLLTAIGSDAPGKALKKVIQEENINESAIYQTSSHGSDTHIHLTSSGRDQTTLHYTGAFLSLGKKEINSNVLPFRWLHIADIPPDKKTLQALLALANKASARVSINPRYVHTYHSSWLIKVFKECDWVFINRDEASLLLGGYFSLREAAEKLQASGISAGVVYDNIDGSATFYANNIYEAGLYGNSKMLEPSGGEAVFSAAFVAATLQEKTIEERITTASAQAASVKSIVGARSAILKKPALRTLKIIETKGYPQ